MLPLKQSEKKKLIDPWSPKIHPEELEAVVRSPLVRDSKYDCIH